MNKDVFAKRVDLIKPSGIRQIFNLAFNMKDPINLSIGEPDFKVPEVVAENIAKALKNGFTKYTATQGNESLRKKIIEKYYKDKYKSENIIITSGVSGAIYLLFTVLVEEGDNVILFDPYFALYRELAVFFGASVSLVDTYPNFRITKEMLDKSYRPNTKLIMLNSPSNPSGTVYSKEEIKLVADFAKEHDILVVSDEIYNSFNYDKEVTSISEYYNNTVILNGFSKSFALTGERIGYAIADKAIIEEMTKIQQYSFVCSPAIVQKGIEESLDVDLTKYIDEYKIKRDIVYESLKDLTDFTKPMGAFYAFPMLKNSMTASDFTSKAIEKSVLIIPGRIFSEYDKCFRISFAQDNAILKKGLDILKSLL